MALQINFTQAQRLENEWVLLLLWVGFTLLMTASKQNLRCVKSGHIALWHIYAPGKQIKPVFFQGYSDSNEDADMKIIPSGRMSYPIKDPTEDEIDIYFRHKHNGNIQIAKVIGEKLAEQVATYHLDCFSQDLLGEYEKSADIPKYNQTVFDEQARMLYVYTVEKLARKWAPDSILSQMVIASLGDSIEQHFPGFYRRMEECRAYTMYKLCGARRSGVERSVGEAFAHMVGHKEDEVYIATGSQIYAEMEKNCTQVFNSADLEQ